MLPVAGAASKINFLDPPDKLTPPQPRKPAKLTYRTLGNTGLKRKRRLRLHDHLRSQRHHAGSRIGIAYFDTARVYQHGNNERMVAAALGSKRKELVLSTKSVSGSKEALLKDLDTSLAETKTDYVDIWYLHAKDTPGAIHDDMVEAQHIAKQQGKIRFAGMSTNALPEMTEWTIDKKAFDVVLTVYNFTMDLKRLTRPSPPSQKPARGSSP